MSDLRLTFPTELLLLARTRTVETLLGALDAGGPRRLESYDELKRVDAQMQRLAGDIVESALLRAEGDKRLAFMAIFTALIEVFWRIMSSVDLSKGRA
jgi:hypothetical protein